VFSANDRKTPNPGGYVTTCVAKYDGIDLYYTYAKNPAFWPLLTTA